MNKKFLFAAAILLITAALLLTACGGGKELIVNFDSNGGTPVSSITLKQGENVIAPADPEKTGYEFGGWYIDPEFGDNSEYLFNKAPAESITLYAKWITKRFTYTFYNEDGTTVVKSETADYGTAITAPANPVKAATAQYTYSFYGWDKTIPAELTENITFTAQFAQTVNQYTYTFFADDGVTPIKTETVDYGADIIAPVNPTKAATAQYTYSFSGWGKTIPAELTENTTFTAQFAQTVNRYTYTFFADDGVTPIKTETADYGSDITPPVNPIKATTAQYTYSFYGWDKTVPSTLVETIIFTAQFAQTVNQYTYIFYSDDGTTVLKSKSADYGSAIVAPNTDKTATELYSYVFSGWDKAIPTELTGDISFIASYVQSKVSYTIAFVERGGSEVADIVEVWGTEIDEPEEPERAGYTFYGWLDEEENVYVFAEMPVGGITLYAVWIANTNTLYLNKNGGEGGVDSVTADTDETIVLPENDFTRAGYTFSGWAVSAGGAVAYSDKASYTMGTEASYTLYAVWTANINELLLDPNGAAGGGTSLYIASYVTITLPANAYRRSGYSFLGWAEASDGEAVYADKANYTMGTDEIYVLFAIWEAMSGTEGLKYTQISYSTEYEVSGIGTASVTDIVIPAYYEGIPVVRVKDNAFKNNETLTSVVIADGIREIGDNAFYGCTQLTGIELPQTLQAIGIQAFESTGLTGIELPDNLGFIGMNAFANCRSLTSIRIPQQASIAGSVFINCTALTEILVDDNSVNYISIDGVLFNLTGTALFAYPAGKADVSYIVPDGVITIADFAFANNGYLESLALGGDVASIGGNAFDGCVKLTEIDLPTGLESIGSSAFNNCSHLISITIPEGVTELNNGLFGGCTSLESVTVLGGIIGIGDEAFAFCTSLTSIVIPASVTNIGYMAFNGCALLKTVIMLSAEPSVLGGYFGNEAFDATHRDLIIMVPADSVTAYKTAPGWSDYADKIVSADGTPGLVFTLNSSGTEYTVTDYIGDATEVYFFSTYHGKPVTAIGERAFFEYYNLTGISIPEGVTGIGKEAFAFCSGLTSVVLPESVTSIGEGAFWFCTALASVNIPGNVTVLTMAVFGACAFTSIVLPAGLLHIGDGAFWACQSLTSVGLPEGILTIGEAAFAQCREITSVVIPASVTSIGEGAFYACFVLVGIEVDYGNTCYKSVDGVLFNKAGTLLHTYPSAKIESYYEIPAGVTEIYNFSNNGNIEEIVLPSGLKEIRGGVFELNNNLISIALPAGLESIGNLAFYGCSSLSSITIPAGVTSIGFWAFSGCGSLTIYCEASSPAVGWDAEWKDSECPVVWSSDGVMHTFSFVTNGGSDIAPIEDYNVASMPLPEKVGCEFAGWFTNEALIGGPVSFPYFSKTVLTLYANWVEAGTEGLEYILTEGVYEVSSVGAAYDEAIITVPSYHLGIPVRGIGVDAFYECENLIAIVLPEGLTYIDKYAFTDCYALADVTLPSTLVYIGKDAFASCAITSIMLPYGLSYIGKWAFYGCHNLTEITIPASAVSVYANAFEDCTSLTAIYVEEDNLYYQSIDGILFDKGGTALLAFPCGKAASYIVPEGVISIGEYAFSYNEILTSVTIAASVEEIGEGALSDCPNLISIIFAAGSALRSIGEYAFGYTAITTIELPEGIESINGSTFSGCVDLPSIVIPASVTYIGEWAFGGCESLISIIFGEGSNLSEIDEYAFYDCRALENIGLPDGLLSIGEEAFNGCRALLSLVIPAGITKIDNYTFAYCYSLESLTFAEGSLLASIGEGAFTGCESLINIVFPGGLVSVGDYAFMGCDALESADFGEHGLLQSLGKGAFFYCVALATVVLPENLTSIGESAFESCESLTSLTVYAEAPPSLGAWALVTGDSSILRIYVHAASVEDYKLAWPYDDSIVCLVSEQELEFVLINEDEEYEVAGIGTITGSSVTVPATYNGKPVTSIGDGAFEGNYDVESVSLPYGLIRIGEYAFAGTALASVTIPASVTILCEGAFRGIIDLVNVTFAEISALQTIASGAFKNCDGLQEIVIPASVVEIGDAAFYNCTVLYFVQFAECSLLDWIGDDAFAHSGLEEIVLPALLWHIGENAFAGCEELYSLTVLALIAPQLSFGALEDTNEDLEIYVPASVLSQYKNTEGWIDFADIIFAIE